MSYAGWRLFPVAWSAPEEQRHLICTWARAEVMSVNPVLEMMMMMMMIIVLEFDRQGTPPLSCLQPLSWEYYHHFTNEETEFRLFGQRPSFSTKCVFLPINSQCICLEEGFSWPHWVTDLPEGNVGQWVHVFSCRLTTPVTGRLSTVLGP